MGDKMKKIMLLLVIVALFTSCMNSTSDAKIQFVDRIFNNYAVRNIVFESDGTAWLLVHDVGVIRYETDGSWELFDHTNSIINEDLFSIRDMVVDGQDRLWIGNDGLVCYDDGFVRYDSSNSPMTGNYVNCIEIDSQDKVWFSVSAGRTNSGLGCYDQGTISMHIPEHTGVIRNMGDMAIDMNDHIWCSSIYTLYDTCLYEYDQSEWTVYDTVDIGFNPYFIQNIWVNPDNELIASISYALSSSMINEDGPLWFKYDGERFEVIENDHSTLPKAYMDDDGYFWSTYQNKLKIETEEGLLEKTVLYIPYSVHGSPTGDIWVSSDHGVYIYRIGD